MTVNTDEYTIFIPRGNIISAFCKTYHEKDQNLPLLTLLYSTKVHEVGAITPSSVVNGCKVNLPLNVMLGMASLDGKATASKYVNKLQTYLQACFTEVWKSLQKFRDADTTIRCPIGKSTGLETWFIFWKRLERSKCHLR